MRFDLVMPTVLFLVTLAALFLGKRTEKKLKSTVEQRQFGNRDTALLVVLIAASISIVIFVPGMAILAVFLFSYSSLLFTVSYAFSDSRRNRAGLFCIGILIASFTAGLAHLVLVPSGIMVFGVLAFTGLVGVSFGAYLYVTFQSSQNSKRWYLAALPPALFLILYFFFNGTIVWFPFLLDIYGITFALLIVLYLGSLFTWKTVFVFAALITVMDIILVWVTGTMVTAAKAVAGFGLPVMVSFPTFPPIISEQYGLEFLNLGLGDFFFAGILGVQTQKRFGVKTAILSLITICVSFGLFELLLLNPSSFSALPATLPIILGWLPVIGVRLLLDRSKGGVPVANEQQAATA